MLGMDMKVWPRDENVQREAIVKALVENTTFSEAHLRNVLRSHQTLGKVKAGPIRDNVQLPDKAKLSKPVHKD